MCSQLDNNNRIGDNVYMSATKQTQSTNRENKMNYERGQEYKNKTGKQYFIDMHKLQPPDPKMSFTFFRHCFEDYALNVRELVSQYENAGGCPENFDYYELQQKFEVQKKKVEVVFWKFVNMNKVDPKGCVYDHMEWCSEVIKTCEEHIKYCNTHLKYLDGIYDWELKIGC